MPDEDNEIAAYRSVQNIARETIDLLRSFVHAGQTEKEIAALCEKIQREKGAQGFWYHGLPATVLVGNRSILSMSGREYSPSDEQVNPEDIVTVDLSPEVDGYWGDYARTLIIHGGRVVENSSSAGSARIQEFWDGVQFEKILHQFFQQAIHPDLTFEQVYRVMNEYIVRHGYVNLDFRKNLGHTIEKNINDRIYFEEGNSKRLGEAVFFTFEPHVRADSSRYGYKKEDIYYFSEGAAQVL